MKFPNLNIKHPECCKSACVLLFFNISHLQNSYVDGKAILNLSPQLLHQLLNPSHPLIHILDLHLNFQSILAGE